MIGNDTHNIHIFHFSWEEQLGRSQIHTQAIQKARRLQRPHK